MITYSLSLSRHAVPLLMQQYKVQQRLWVADFQHLAPGPPDTAAGHDSNAALQQLEHTTNRGHRGSICSHQLTGQLLKVGQDSRPC
jgi:hypothetical protein